MTKFVDFAQSNKLVYLKISFFRFIVEFDFYYAIIKKAWRFTMKKYLLPNEGRFYKACMHVHTTISDGTTTPEETKKIYMEKGYSIVAFTDHEVIVPHNDLADENFLPITSYEMGINDNGNTWPFTKTYHLNYYSPDKNAGSHPCFDINYTNYNKAISSNVTEEMKKFQYDRVYTNDCINDIVKKCNDLGGLVSYNHPYWSHQNYSDYINLKGFWGVEVHNTGGGAGGYIEQVTPYKDLLDAGEHLVPLCTDDAHYPSQMGGGWIMVKAKSLDYDVVFSALKNKDLYSSTGPEIYDLFYEDGKVQIKTSKARRIYMSTNCRSDQLFRGANNVLVENATFDLNYLIKSCNEQKAPLNRCYFRFTVEDDNGNKAYTRAYFLDEIL